VKKLYSSRGLYCTGGRDYFLILYSDLLFMVAPYMEKVELVNIERQCIKNARCRFYVPQPTFLFPLETPLQKSRNMLHGWKDNSMLAKPLAVCTVFSCQHLSSTVSQLFEQQVQKIAVFTTRCDA